jgi:adenylate cyclase
MRFSRGGWLVVLGLIGLMSVLGLVGWERTPLHSTELLVYDRYVAALPREKPDPRIVLVALTDETPAKIPEIAAQRPFYPLPRRLHTRAIETLQRAGARVIGLDLMLSQPTDDDQALAGAMQRHGRVVTAWIPTVTLTDGVEQVSFIEPVEPVAQTALLGSILVPRSFGNAVRWVQPYRTNDVRPTERMPHFALTLVVAYNDEATQPPLLRDDFTWGSKLRLPVVGFGDTEQVALMRFFAPFPTAPYERVLDGSWAKTHPPDFFRDKIVLIGRISKHEDQHMTPVGVLPGPVLHATLAAQVLSGSFLRWEESTGWAALLAALLVLSVWRLGLLPGILIGAGVGILWIPGTYLAFLSTGVYREVLPPLAALLVTGALIALFESVRAGKQLARLLPSWALRGALTGRLELGTKARAVSVAFCDIRGFTRFCETHPPEEVETLLRAYFAAGDTAARALGTELDKYLGDAMMLYFADNKKAAEPHEVRALRWAFAMQEAARGLEISIGVGIASGIAHEGLVGVPRRMQPTVIGDVVNVASRLQEASRTLGREVLCDTATAKVAKAMLEIEPIGEISVRGKQESMTVWTWTGESQ